MQLMSALAASHDVNSNQDHAPTYLRSCMYLTRVTKYVCGTTSGTVVSSRAKASAPWLVVVIFVNGDRGTCISTNKEVASSDTLLDNPDVLSAPSTSKYVSWPVTRRKRHSI